MGNKILALVAALLPKNYNLELELDPSKPNFKGSLTADLRVNKKSNANGISQFELHSRNLVITSASITTEAREYPLTVSCDETAQLAVFQFSKGNSLPSLEESETIQLNVKYVGSVQQVSSNRDQTVGIFKSSFNDGKNHIFATHCQPSFARSIFPCIDEPSFKCSIQLSIKTLTGFKVLSNVSQQSIETTTKNGYKLVKFNKTPLMTTSVFGFVAGHLDVLKSQVPEQEVGYPMVPIAVYSPIQINDATFTLDTILKYLPKLQSFFQNKFPLDKLDFVLLPFLNDMAMENFGLITIQMNHLLLSPTNLSNNMIRLQCEQLIVHELVHQWMGNFVSFDSWSHLWFNESFATWLACHLVSDNDTHDNDSHSYWNSDAYLLQQLEPQLISDSTITRKSIMDDISQLDLNKQDLITNDIFNHIAYTKGITMLRSLQLCIGDQLLSKAMSDLFNDNLALFHEKSVKPMDIWNHVGKFLKSENIPNFMSSWTRIPGFPLLSVSKEDAESTNLVQHRFLVDSKLDQVEDVPYHIPLFIKLPNGELDKENILMTDRTMNLKYPITLCNHNAQGYYRVSYESGLCYADFIKQIEEDKLSQLDLMKIIVDLSHIIGNPNYEKPIHLLGFFKLFKYLSEKVTKKPDLWEPISQCLSILEAIQLSVRVYGKGSKSPLGLDIITILWNAINLDTKSTYELQALGSLLTLTKTEPRSVEVAESYYSTLRSDSSDNKKVPSELVSSIFQVIVANLQNVKQWKKFHELIKATDRILKNIEGSYYPEGEQGKRLFIEDIYDNLGRNNDEELVKKTLNFIDGTIENEPAIQIMQGLANSIVGEPAKIELVWDWFVSHFHQWLRRSQKIPKISIIVESISFSVFQLVQVSHSDDLRSFIESEKDQVKDKLDLEGIWVDVQSAAISRLKLYEDSNSL
ncbi:hypothetical protein NCAS_0B06620 [Naumovozyma castellii]|uniref:Aminopeptidase n=1 Tax=Naumovozyma castellii TaxID=27288 RepID=G0V9X9_NAUCA|nr:hypothetical protein NCAS_0B06620 [Naumovozyma castellii CBS 4309]CCC68746.1 hypothetical protein NCAS_0B06620 [Naumovozyma castellii CBS 4309]